MQKTKFDQIAITNDSLEASSTQKKSNKELLNELTDIPFKIDTHLVIKRDDILQGLSGVEREILFMLYDKIKSHRAETNRVPAPRYLVVNTDEPYVDEVHAEILHGERLKEIIQQVQLAQGNVKVNLSL